MKKQIRAIRELVGYASSITVLEGGYYPLTLILSQGKRR